MLVEVDQVAVDSLLLSRAREGDKEAIEEIKKDVNGLVLYLHALPVPPNEELITLRELDYLTKCLNVTIGFDNV